MFSLPTGHADPASKTGAGDGAIRAGLTEPPRPPGAEGARAPGFAPAFADVLARVFATGTPALAKTAAARVETALPDRLPGHEDDAPEDADEKDPGGGGARARDATAALLLRAPDISAVPAIAGPAETLGGAAPRAAPATGISPRVAGPAVPVASGPGDIDPGVGGAAMPLAAGHADRATAHPDAVAAANPALPGGRARGGPPVPVTRIASVADGEIAPTSANALDNMSGDMAVTVRPIRAGAAPQDATSGAAVRGGPARTGPGEPLVARATDAAMPAALPGVEPRSGALAQIVSSAGRVAAAADDSTDHLLAGADRIGAGGVAHGGRSGLAAASAQPPAGADARAAVAQIAAAVQGGGDGPVEILLNPAELGKVRITLTPGEAGMAVSILADRPETLDLLRRHADLLARDFRDLGYAGTAFSFGAGGGTQRRDDGPVPDGDRAAVAATPADAAAAPKAAADPPAYSTPGPDGGMDIRL